jgi:uncharacterized membrane protein
MEISRKKKHNFFTFSDFNKKLGLLEVFEKMTNGWPSLLAPVDKIVPIIACERRF